MHNKKIHWAGLLLIVSLSWTGMTTLQAQPVEKIITMDEAVEMALKNNLLVSSEDLKLDTKRRQRDLAWNYFLPTITASGILVKKNDINPPLPDRFTLIGGLNFLLPINGQMIYGIRQAFLDYEAGVISLDTVKRKMEREVRKAFLVLIVAEETIKLTNRKVTNASTRYEQAKTNYHNGLVDEYAMLSAQVALEALKPALMEAENAYTSTMLAFKLMIGLELNENVKLKGTIEPTIAKLDVQKLLPVAIENNPDLITQKALLKSAENVKALEIAGFFPTLTLGLNIDPTFGRDPFNDSLFADIERDWAQVSGAFNLTLSVPLHNLIPGSKAWQKIKDLENQIELNQLNLKNTIKQTEVDINLAVLKLQKSEEAIRSYQLALKLAEKANAMGQQAYKAGLKEYSQIQETEVALYQAQLDLLKEKNNYATALLDLNYIINTSLDKVKE